MMRIGAGVPSFYNASSKIHNLSNAEEIRKISAGGANSANREGADEGSRYIAEHGGVIQTRVSPENAYQKAMLDSPRAAVEDMADKLMSRMPRILEDMKKIPDTDTAVENEKVVVTDRNAAAVADRNAKMTNDLMNFSL